MAITRAWSEVDGRSPFDLPPLYNYVDTEALDDLVASIDDGAVTFSIEQYLVTVEVGPNSVSITIGERS